MLAFLPLCITPPATIVDDGDHGSLGENALEMAAADAKLVVLVEIEAVDLTVGG